MQRRRASPRRRAFARGPLVGPYELFLFMPAVRAASPPRRFTHNTMLEQLQREYVLSARTKGLNE
jgi:hypothetical protein